MPRRPDDDRDPPRTDRRPRGTSPTTLVLLVVGGLFLFGLLACGGVVLIGYRQAQKAEAIFEENMARAGEDLAREQAREAAGRNADGLPDPADGKPVPDPAPKAPATPRDGPDDARWFVLFRGTDPAIWNTTTNAGAAFAVPVRCAPTGVTFVRVRRPDTGAAVIVPTARERLASQAFEDKTAPRWNGENRDEHGGRHLGIGHGTRSAFMQGKGLIAVVMDGFDATTGTGFGHAHHGDEGGQRQVWKGEEIRGVVLEIAVLAGDLTAAEAANLAK